jgi:hypothetical protein
MTETEMRAQAMINGLVAQRNQAMDQCVNLAADLALAKARIGELEKAAATKSKKAA